MIITISPLQTHEVPIYTQVEISAFTSHPRWPLLWPNGETQDLLDYYNSSHLDSLQNDPECRMMKAVDTDTGKIVGVAEWTFCINGNEGLGEDNDEGEKPGNWPRDGNWEMRSWFKKEWKSWRRGEFGRGGFICLDFLVISPDLQRGGVGTKLLSWGVEEADRLGLPMCLEATPNGFGLYKKFGFEKRKIVAKDMRDFGCEKELDPEASARIYMVRQKN